MKAIHICITSFIWLLLSSCEKKELPIPAYNRGEVQTVQLDLGADYKYQFWYDLGDNKVAAQNLRSDWDLSFECSGNYFAVYLNSSRLMQAALCATTEFASVKSHLGLNFHADHPGRNMDSLAIGNRLGSDLIYVIDMGYYAKGKQLGYKKFSCSIVSGSYIIHWADLGGTNETQFKVIPDLTYNRIGYSFSNNQVVYFEPEKSSFDICVTQYTYFFDVPYMPYLVTGVLLNESKVSVAVDSANLFASITKENIADYKFNDSLDVIGYSWKQFDFDEGTYKVFDNKNYIILDHEGFYYKLHFVDFYNAAGEKGSPKFEFQKL